MRLAATAELEAFYDTLINMPVLALVEEDDEGICGVGGLTIEAGVCWIFFDLKRVPKCAGLKIRKAMRKLLGCAHALNIHRVFIVRDKTKETSMKVLTIFGFKHYSTVEGQEVWVIDVRI